MIGPDLNLANNIYISNVTRHPIVLPSDKESCGEAPQGFSSSYL